MSKDDNTMVPMLQGLLEVYEFYCRPVCEKYEIPQTAFDILLFLGNNPDKTTARDIERFRRIKPSMVSLYVNRLVNEGFLERHSIPGDRRCVKLVCTDKAQPVITDGRECQQEFFDAITEGITQEEKELFAHIQSVLRANIAACKKKVEKGKRFDD